MAAIYIDFVWLDKDRTNMFWYFPNNNVQIYRFWQGSVSYLTTDRPVHRKEEIDWSKWHMPIEKDFQSLMRSIWNTDEIEWKRF